ncbi:hypothetical protein D030_1344B, partial [Vibrio parahaemolyticus AQ3810]
AIDEVPLAQSPKHYCAQTCLHLGWCRIPLARN